MPRCLSDSSSFRTTLPAPSSLQTYTVTKEALGANALSVSEAALKQVVQKAAPNYCSSTTRLQLREGVL